MRKTFYSLFVLVLFLTMAHTSNAADIGSVSILNVKLDRREDSIQVAFLLKNISEIKQNVHYGIRLQSIVGNDTYEMPVSNVLLDPSEELIQYATIKLPTLAAGTYDVFLLSRDDAGIVSMLKYVNKLELKEQDFVADRMLDKCEYNTSKKEIFCSIIGAEDGFVDINYIVNTGSKYGSIVAEGASSNVKIIDRIVTIPMSDTLTNGTYTYRLWLNDKTITKELIIKDITYTATEATKPISASNACYQKEETSINIKTFIIFLPVVFLFLLLYFSLRRPKVGIMLLVSAQLAVATCVYAAITITDTQQLEHIFSGFSADSGQEQFIVTLDSTEYDTTDELGFSILFQEVILPNNKPLGGSLDVNLDGGEWQTLVSSSDEVAIYHKSLSPISMPGEHVLNFRSPDLCGSAFDFSIFGVGVFGATDCIFSMPVTVLQNEPPTTPHIGGDCTVGEICNIGIVSRDSDGGQLCYTVKALDNSFVNVGCATEGTPVSISRRLSSCSAQSATVQAYATDSKGAQSPLGTGSPDITGSIMCTEPCAHCIYNGSGGDISITALPPFLPQNGTVEVSWNLIDVASCTVTGKSIGSGTTVDFWDWDVIRNNNKKVSSELDSATEYSLKCTGLDGVIQKASVVVSTIPAWQEF